MSEKEYDPKDAAYYNHCVHVPLILDSLSEEYIKNFQPVHKRYYTEYCYNKKSTENKNLDSCIRIHTNKVTVVYLGKNHTIFAKGKEIKNINFQVSNKVNRLDNKVSGKGKKGAQWLQPESILCILETEDDKYPVYAGVTGKLLEINTKIQQDPNLLLKDPISDGFVAVILQDLKKFHDTVAALEKVET